MSFLARVWNQQQWAYCPHTSVSGEAWELYGKGTTDSAGAGATTVWTTAVDSARGNGGAEADDLFNGQYWFRCTSGANSGAMKRIVDFVSASGTITFENNGFTAQVASGTEYEIWKSPEPVVVAAGGGSTTSTTFATRTEPAEFWEDFYLVVISGTYRGETAQITGQTALGVFTHSALSNALGAGDVCLLRRFVEVGNLSMSLSEDYVPRPGSRVNFSVGDGIVGAKGGSVSFTTQVRPSKSLPGGVFAANPPDIAKMFQAAGLVEVVDSSSAESGGASTTSRIDITDTTQENFTFGNAVIINNELGFIVDITDSGGGAPDDLDITPSLSVPPESTDVVNAMRMYRKSLDGDLYGVVVETEVDGIRTTMTGCKGTFDLVENGAVELNWNLQVDHWIREIEAAPYNAGDAYSTTPPVMAHDRICYLGSAVDTLDTKVDMNGFTCSPGAVASPRNIQGSKGLNGRCGYQFTDLTGAGCTFNELLDSSGTLAQDLRWLVRTARDIAVIYGRGDAKVAIRIPVGRLIESPHPAEADGMASVPSVISAQDAGSKTVTATSTITKRPDFYICIS